MTIKVQIEAVYGEFVTATKMLGDVFGGVMDGMKAELKDWSDAAKADMEGHESATEQFANILKSNMKGVTGAVEGVKIAWAQLAVIFEAGHFLAETVTETIKMTTEAQKLGRTLGVSATQASYLSVAIGDAHGTTQQYTAMAKGLDQQLKMSEKGMNAFGLETRDAGGHLKEQNTLVMDALEVLRGYKEGTDRNIAAQKLFGRGIDVSSEMLSLTAEKMADAKEKADAFGLAVGADDVEASDRFRAALNDMGDIIDAVKKAIGSALLPVLDDLAEWFTTYGPQAILTIKVAIDIVISVFKGLALAVKVVWEVVKLAFNNMVTIASGFADVFTKLFHGDFEGAGKAAENMLASMGTNISAAFSNIVSEAEEAGGAITDMWANTIAGPKPAKDSGAESSGTEDADISKPGKKAKDTSAADARRAAAEAKKLLKEQYDMVMEAYKGEEQAAKDNLGKILEIQRREYDSAVAMYGAKSKQAEAAANRIAETEQKLADQLDRLDLARGNSHRMIQKMLIDEDQKDAEARYANGDLTTRELTALEQRYENDRYALDMQALLDEGALNGNRVEEHQATLLKMEELDEAHAQRARAIVAAGGAQRVQTAKQVEGLIAQSGTTAMMGLINRTMTWGQAVRGVFTSILQGVVQMFATWAAKQAAHYIMDRIMHKTNLVAKAAAEKLAAASSIAAAAGIAGANGVASFAGAPWPIDVGAPGFGAAMAMAAGSFGGIAAAEGGYDIPRGVNPLTQLHQNEMVLPSPLAQGVRDMVTSGGPGGGGGHTYVINANDALSFREMLRRDPAGFADALGHAQRMGHLSRVRLT